MIKARREAGLTHQNDVYRGIITFPKQSSGAQHEIRLVPDCATAHRSASHSGNSLAVGCVFDLPSREARAQQVQQGPQIDLDYSLPTRRDKLRVRRPPKMPPTPTDFGPHFDFPSGGSQNFNCGPGYGYYCGAPSEAPYPH